MAKAQIVIGANSGGGYRIAEGTDTFANNAVKEITVGFKPKKIYVYPVSYYAFQIIYDEDVSTTNSLHATGGIYSEYVPLNDLTKQCCIYSVKTTSFEVKGFSDERPFQWVAIG